MRMYCVYYFPRSMSRIHVQITLHDAEVTFTPASNEREEFNFYNISIRKPVEGVGVALSYGREVILDGRNALVGRMIRIEA
jgi:hypothetical protein